MKAFAPAERWLLLLIGVLLLLAVFLNLGMWPLNSDGGLRGLTALEMELNEEYIVPTQNGHFYYRKPPVFNWTIVASHRLFGDWSNFTIRFPVGVALLLWGATIAAILRKWLGTRSAVLVALISITGGHMLFESSRYGRIDMLYSWMIWTTFMAVFYFYEKQQWWRLFLVAYALAALSFLTKGLPTVVFMGCTLMGWFFINRQWKRFFSIQHIAGGLLFLLIVGSYYFAYELRNPGHFPELIGALWTDSNERTISHFGLGKTLGHMALFPVKLLYEILPWSLLVIACVRRGWWQQLKAQPLLWFTAVVFLANIWVYWTSPGNNTRYLLMFFPLLSVVLLYFVEQRPMERQNHLITVAFRVILLLAAAGIWVLPFLPEFETAPSIWLKCALLSVAFGGLAMLSVRMPKSVLLLMVAGVLLGRVGFNWILSPALAPHSTDMGYQLGAEKMAEITQGEPFYILAGATVNTDISTYITRERNQILLRHYRDTMVQNNTYYIIDENQHKLLSKAGVRWQEFHNFVGRSGKTRIHLVKFENYPEVKVPKP